MFVVVSYDVVEDRRRTKVAKFMEDYGRRVQKSVFDCVLDEDKLQRLKGLLGKLIDHETDSVRFYRICRSCRTGIEVMGRGTVRDDEDVIVV